jgi:hypothetical protein
MMKRHLSCLMFAVLASAVGPTACQAATIAHWSFDASSLSHDGGGNIVGASEATGNHDATIGMGVGSGTGASGGPTFDSNPIPGTNSVAGKFGQALTLSGFTNKAAGGGQFLEFPNLTELMTAASAPGAPSYTVSYWIKTAANAPANQFTVLSDWGNSGVNPGKFAYGFGFNVTSGTATPPNTAQIRAQARSNTGPPVPVNGADIFARAVNAPSINNGDWHMLTWTFDTSIGQLKSYVDGALVDTLNLAAGVNRNMILSSSPVGTFGFKGDPNNATAQAFINGSYTLDEVWVATNVLDAEGVENLFRFNLIPEPSSLVMVVLCSLGLTITRLRRRN